MQYCQVLDQRLGSRIELSNSLPDIRCVGGKIIRPEPRADGQRMFVAGSPEAFP